MSEKGPSRSDTFPPTPCSSLDYARDPLYWRTHNAPPEPSLATPLYLESESPGRHFALLPRNVIWGGRARLDDVFVHPWRRVGIGANVEHPDFQTLFTHPSIQAFLNALSHRLGVSSSVVALLFFGVTSERDQIRDALLVAPNPAVFQF